MCFYGETASKGNRFFDLKNISKGEITFKLNKNTHVPIRISNKKHKKDLIKLSEQDLILLNMNIFLIMF